MKYEEAVVAFEKVLKTEPKQMSAYVGIAEALISLEKKDEAVTWLEQALDIVETDYSKTDNRFQDTSRVLSRLMDLYKEKEEAEKTEHVRKILREEELEEETDVPEDTEDVPDLSVARPDLTKMQLEQVICYLYEAGNEPEKQWQFNELTSKEAGQVIEACLLYNAYLGRQDQLDLNIQYTGDERIQIAKTTAVQFLNGIGISMKTFDFSSTPELQEENGAILHEEMYGDSVMFAHIVNLIPENDGSITITGNVGWMDWEYWPREADIMSDLAPELI